MKIIIRSSTLMSFLIHTGSLIKSTNPDLNFIPIYVRDGKFGIDGLKYFISVEASKEGFLHIEISKLKCLLEVLKVIDDQPLTLVIGMNEIEVENIIF